MKWVMCHVQGSWFNLWKSVCCFWICPATLAFALLRQFKQKLWINVWLKGDVTLILWWKANDCYYSIITHCPLHRKTWYIINVRMLKECAALASLHPLKQLNSVCSEERHTCLFAPNGLRKTVSIFAEDKHTQTHKEPHTQRRREWNDFKQNYFWSSALSKNQFPIIEIGYRKELKLNEVFQLEFTHFLTLYLALWCASV